jgi:hypothetical protein
MIESQKPNWICKLGLHKWRHYGEPVVITWKEPRPIKIRYGNLNFTQRSKRVLTKRKRLRCGIRVKRKLTHNPDGTLSCVGWEPTSKYE